MEASRLAGGKMCPKELQIWVLGRQRLREAMTCIQKMRRGECREERVESTCGDEL